MAPLAGRADRLHRAGARIASAARHRRLWPGHRRQTWVRRRRGRYLAEFRERDARGLGRRRAVEQAHGLAQVEARALRVAEGPPGEAPLEPRRGVPRVDGDGVTRGLQRLPRPLQAAQRGRRVRRRQAARSRALDRATPARRRSRRPRRGYGPGRPGSARPPAPGRRRRRSPLPPGPAPPPAARRSPPGPAAGPAKCANRAVSRRRAARPRWRSVRARPAPAPRNARPPRRRPCPTRPPPRSPGRGLDAPARGRPGTHAHGRPGPRPVRRR